MSQLFETIEPPPWHWALKRSITGLQIVLVPLGVVGYAMYHVLWQARYSGQAALSRAMGQEAVAHLPWRNLMTAIRRSTYVRSAAGVRHGWDSGTDHWQEDPTWSRAQPRTRWRRTSGHDR